MASTDKTPKLGLNQWAAGDDVLRADFNADNGKIDTAVEANRVAVAAATAGVSALMTGKVGLRFGTIIGDGTEDRVVSLGFRPLLMLVQCRYQKNAAILIMTPDCSSVVFSAAPYCLMQFYQQSNIHLTADGFAMKTSTDFNVLDSKFFYAAFY
ncbi:MAG: hypothetical protein RSB98_07705 [Raoultibacter sp.]